MTVQGVYDLLELLHADVTIVLHPIHCVINNQAHSLIVNYEGKGEPHNSVYIYLNGINTEYRKMYADQYRIWKAVPHNKVHTVNQRHLLIKQCYTSLSFLSEFLNTMILSLEGF
jgi:hypothetical protein